MQIELGFLDHLMGMLALDGVSGYDTRGSSTSITAPAAQRRAARPRPAGLERCRSPPCKDSRLRSAACSPSSRRSTSRATTSPTPTPKATRARRRSCRPTRRSKSPRSSALTGKGATARHGRQRGDVHPHPQRLPRRPVPHAEQRAERLPRPQPKSSQQAQARVQRTFRHRASRASCRRSGARGAASPTRPPAKRPSRASSPRASSSRARSTSSARQLDNDLRSGQPAIRVADGRRPAKCRTTPTRSPSSTGRSSSPKKPASSPTSMLDRRDLLLDKLSSLAQHHRHPAARRHRHGDLRRRRQTARRRHDRQLAAGAHRGGRRPARRAARADEPERARCASYQTALDAVAATLAESVNALHTSTPFFSRHDRRDARGGGHARGSPDLLDRSGRRQRRGAGDRGLRGGSADQSYSALVERVGSDVKTAQDEQTNLQTTVTAIGNQRQSVSGVSLDEEMTNLITFQRGYQASARTLTAMDRCSKR